MKRRDFIAGIGTLATSPFVARAQQPVMPVIGFLSGGSPSVFAPYVVAFNKGLNEFGLFEHRNVGIDYRWAVGHFELLPGLAAELIGRQVAVIAAFGPPAALAAKAATSTIPIVFGNGADPVKLGLVASYNHPGGNATGLNFLINTLGAKELGLMRELVPEAKIFGLLINSDNADAQTQSKDAQEAANVLGLQLHVISAAKESDIDEAFTELSKMGVGALLVGASTFFSSHMEQLFNWTNRLRLPTLFNNRLYVEAGGLISYGSDVDNGYRQVGIYVGRILKGEKPADLPVIQATKLELAINLKTAKALGLTIPQTLLATADEVIE
jgi:putative tryptophan/tyrosine transport system substrate-binding protein